MKSIRYLTSIWVGLAATLSLAPAAWADNVAHCEALIMQIVEDETGAGEAQIASYRPAVHFLASLYDEEDGHLDHMNGFPIRAIMCRRNSVLPAETDYPILATGLPFILSQDFDSSETDSLTMFWKDGVLDYVYKGHPLSDIDQALLDSRLADFSEQGLTTQKTQNDVVETPEISEAEEMLAEFNALNTIETEELELETIELETIELETIELDSTALNDDTDIEISVETNALTEIEIDDMEQAPTEDLLPPVIATLTESDK